MPTFTSSRYSVSAATLSANITLEALRQAMLNARPDHAALTGGWAGTEDSGSNIKQPNVAPPVSDPELLPDEGYYPERLAARYYFFRKDAQLARSLPDAPPQAHHFVDAIDVMISPVPKREKTFQVLIATTPGATIGGLLRALRAAATVNDETASVRLDGANLAFNPDLFLWLLVRTREDPQIDGATAIEDVLSTSAQDSTRRGTKLSDGVDFDRPSLLVAVAEIDQLGPVGVALRDSELNAKVTADIYAGGRFSIRKRQTHYPDIVGVPETRLTSVQDFAFVLMPKVIGAYLGDDDWDADRRSAEIRSAAQSLIARYEQKIQEFDAAISAEATA